MTAAPTHSPTGPRWPATATSPLAQVGRRAHWVHECVYLGRDRWGDWFGQLPGWGSARPGRVVVPSTNVTLVPPSGDFAYTRNAAPHHTRIYIDIAWDVRFEGGEPTGIDMDLDVVAGRDREASRAARLHRRSGRVGRAPCRLRLPARHRGAPRGARRRPREAGERGGGALRRRDRPDALARARACGWHAQLAARLAHPTSPMSRPSPLAEPRGLDSTRAPPPEHEPHRADLHKDPARVSGMFDEVAPATTAPTPC